MKATKTIPLAPSAPPGPIRRHKNTAAFQWKNWLSPKVPHPRIVFPIEGKNSQSDYDYDDDSPQSRHQQRPRRASFDLTASAPHVRLNKERGGESYSNSNTSFGRRSIDSYASKSIGSEDNMSPLTMPRSTDDVLDDARGGGLNNSAFKSRSHSLLTPLLNTLLIHLNSLLPEYCDHLSTTSDTLHSIRGASEAVGVLERGSKTISNAFGANKTLSSPKRTPPSTRMSNASSAPSSPCYLSSSPKKHLTPTSDSAVSPSKLASDFKHWLSPLSPGRSHRSKTPPRKRSQKSGMKGNSEAESEWERFVSPFLMLVGAECLYGRMEHVLDPKVSMGESPKDFPSNKGDRKEGSSFVKFATQPGSGPGEQNGSTTIDNASGNFIHQGNDPTPPVSPNDANKRGSRRLIAMYLQIREDLIIVGEYLCDPVLGPHARGAASGDGKQGKKGSIAQRLPPPPLPLDTPAVSPEKDSVNRRKSSGDENPNNINKYTAHEQAISLLNTLDALISFIDARCVLIRIHAELCCSSPPLLSSVEVGDGSGKCSQKNTHLSEGRGRKWIVLAEQCKSVMDPVSAWAKEKGWRAVSNIEKELKAMELALTSIHYLFECNLFNCVLNARRLHVLLGKTHYQQTCLPIMYIRSSLPELLAIMHIFFADAGEMLQSLSLQPSSTSRSLQSSGLSPNRKLSNKLEDPLTKSSTGKSKLIDFNSFFAEFVGRCRNGLPLAVLVVRRAGGRRDLSPDERQGDGGEDEEHPESVSSWEPLYMKSTLDDSTSIFKRRGQGPNLVRIIKENFSADRDTDAKTSDVNVDNTNNAKKGGMGTSWPFNEWSQIEKLLTEHYSATETTYSAKHFESVDVKTPLSNNEISGKIQRHSSSSKHSKVISHCHISSITDSIGLIVIQGAGNSKRHRASDDDILLFMQMMVSKLCPENLLSIKVVMRLKSDLFDVEERPPDHSKILTSADDNVPTVSLWSESGWSDAQRKEILHSLGLRRKHSPAPLAPLKSPYIRRQLSGKLGRQRKKMKNSINHGHLDLFLGPELSRRLQDHSKMQRG